MKKPFIISLLAVLFLSISGRAEVNSGISIVVGGVSHSLAVSIPTDYNASKSYPLIVGLHYCNGTSTEYLNALKPLCDSLDIIIVCPDNSGQQMTDPAFITASIDTARNLYSINEKEVYLTGMSCNGFALLQMGLNNIYPFKGIFPWAPYFSAFSSTTFNLDSKVPVVLSVGTADDSYGAVLKLYDSLDAHHANVDLVILKDIGHTLAFSEFSNEMIHCVNYLNDTNDITISEIDDFSMFTNDSAKELRIKVAHKYGKSMDIKGISSSPYSFANPGITLIPETDSVIVKISANPKRAGKILMIIEASEVGGTAIEQMAFNVTYKKPETPSTIEGTEQENLLEIYPVPTKNQLFIRSSESTLSVKIVNLAGKEVYVNNNFSSYSPIDVTGFSKGLYFIHAVSKNLDITKQFIIE